MSDEPRDAALDRLYRAGATEDPPQRLDRAVLDLARREVSVRSRPAARLWFPLAWRVPIASAAVVVLSVSLVLLLREQPSTLDPLARAPVERDAASPRVMGERTPPPDTPAPAGPVIPSAPTEEKRARSADPRDRSHPPATSGSAVAVDPQPGQASVPGAPSLPAIQPPDQGPVAPSPREQTVLAAPPAAEAPAGPPAPAATPERQLGARSSSARPPTAEPPAAAASRETGSTASDVARARDQAMGSSRTETATAAPAAQPQRRSAASPGPLAEGGVAANAGAVASQRPQSLPASPPEPELTPEQWLARIEQMRSQGRHDEAATSLQAFRKRFPDYPLPAHLR